MGRLRRGIEVDVDGVEERESERKCADEQGADGYQYKELSAKAITALTPQGDDVEGKQGCRRHNVFTQDDPCFPSGKGV